MVLSTFDLTSRVAIVTGCDTGLGQGMTLGLAQAGHDTVDTNRKIPYGTTTQVQVPGRRFHAIQADLNHQDKMSALVGQAVAAMGRVDILVSNARIIRRYSVLTFTESDWDAVIGLSLKVVFLLSQTVARQFIRQDDGGKTTNTASMLSFQGGIRVPSYIALGSDVLDLTRLPTNEWAGQRINVNAITPGCTVANNTQALRENEKRSQAILKHTSAGRWGEPKDLQGPVVLLASAVADYINDYTLAADGGWLAR